MNVSVTPTCCTTIYIQEVIIKTTFCASETWSTGTDFRSVSYLLILRYKFCPAWKKIHKKLDRFDIFWWARFTLWWCWVNTMRESRSSHCSTTDKWAEETYPEVLPGNGHRRLNLVGVEIHLSQPCTPQSGSHCVGCIDSRMYDEASCHGNHHSNLPPPTNPTFSAVFVMKVEAELEVCPVRGFNIHQYAADNESGQAEAPSPRCGLLISLDVSFWTVHRETLWLRLLASQK